MAFVITGSAKQNLKFISVFISVSLSLSLPPAPLSLSLSSSPLLLAHPLAYTKATLIFPTYCHIPAKCFCISHHGHKGNWVRVWGGQCQLGRAKCRGSENICCI